MDALDQDRGERGSGMRLHEQEDRSLVEAWGEIDLAVRQAVGPLCQVVAERALPVVIDAREITFIDSTGMSILVRMARDAEAGGYPVELRNAPWMLRELLTITGVDQLLPLTEEPAADDEAAGPGSDAPVT